MQLAGSTSAPTDFQSCFACLSTYSCLGNALEETRVVVVASRLSPIGFTSFKLQSTRGWRWDMSVIAKAAQSASGYSRCFRRHVRSDLDVRAFNGLANDIQLSFWQTQPRTSAQSKVHPVFLITYLAELVRCPGERYALGISMRKSCPSHSSLCFTNASHAPTVLTPGISRVPFVLGYIGPASVSHGKLPVSLSEAELGNKPSQPTIRLPRLLAQTCGERTDSKVCRMSDLTNGRPALASRIVMR